MTIINNTPTVGSLFSGIGGFDLGLERAGFKVEWQIENDKFCTSVLERHWPDTPRHGDISAVNSSELRAVDLISGGFPCQDVSVAGRRKGLAGERSGLFFELTRIIGALKPRWTLIENVPGLLSSSDGRDFETVVTSLEELGYGVAWRVLDSQHFGVPQRRRRVFIVGHLGAPCPPEVLFEPESVLGNSPKVEGQGKSAASTDEDCIDKSGRDGSYIPNISQALTSRSSQRYDYDTETFITVRKQVMAHGKETADEKWVEADQSNILTSDGRPTTLAISQNQRGEIRTSDKAPPLTGGGGRPGQGYPAIAIRAADSTASNAVGVREASGVSGRLDTPDTPRYRALGNAVTVPVIEWIGRRILEAHTHSQGI